MTAARYDGRHAGADAGGTQRTQHKGSRPCATWRSNTARSSAGRGWAFGIRASSGIRTTRSRRSPTATSSCAAPIGRYSGQKAGAQGPRPGLRGWRAGVLSGIARLPGNRSRPRGLQSQRYARGARAEGRARVARWNWWSSISTARSNCRAGRTILRFSWARSIICATRSTFLRSWRSTPPTAF